MSAQFENKHGLSSLIFQVMWLCSTAQCRGLSCTSTTTLRCSYVDKDGDSSEIKYASSSLEISHVQQYLSNI